MGSSNSTSGSGSSTDIEVYTGDDDNKKSGRTLNVKPDWNNTSILPPFNSSIESGIGHHS